VIPAEPLPLAEWQTRKVPGLGLDPADAALIERLSPRVAIEGLADGIRVRATSWVGVVRLRQLEVHISPKLVGENLGLLRLLEWTTGLDALGAVHREHDLAVAGRDLPDLLALLFVRATERVVRHGLRSEYIEREDAIPAVRGRVLADRQVLNRHGRLDRVECRFDDRTADLFDNRLLLAAARACAHRTRHAGTRRRARRLSAVLADVCTVPRDLLPRRPVHYNRLNEHYRGAHELAWLLLEGLHGVEDLFRPGGTRSSAFLLDMNALFERFVERLLTVALDTAGVRLGFQRPSRSVVRHADGRPYLRQIPDALAFAGEPAVAVPIDAKYKRYSNRAIDPGDVAQVFLYAHGFGPSPGQGLPQALIVYPSETARTEILPLSLQHVSGTALAGLTAIGVPIPAVLDEVAGGGDGPVLAAVRDAVLDAATRAVRAQ
jgi:5-methylcytosine-specific restriction enzyme subunit McrC